MEIVNANVSLLSDLCRPTFFKIISAGHTDEHLRIPQNFLKHLSEGFNSRVALKGPSGGIWNVGLERTSKGVYLGNGWQKFCKDHSLGDNEFIIVCYNGSMCFDVEIYNKSGIEKEFSFDVKIEELSLPNHQKRKRSKPRKLFDNQVRCQEQETEKFFDDSTWMTKESDTQIITPLKDADSFTSNLPYFKSILGRTSVSGKFYLAIPPSFSRMQLPSFKTEIVLRNLGGKSWVANLRSEGERHYICRGWAVFLRANNLRFGDTCIFELVDRTELLVHVFR